jgi:hypothetical protein
MHRVSPLKNVIAAVRQSYAATLKKSRHHTKQDVL